MIPKIKKFLRSNWWFVLAILIGLFLRTWKLGAVPLSPYWDEMAIWDDALSLVNTGRSLHGRPGWQALFLSYGDFKLPVYIWLTSLMALVTKNPLLGSRLVSWLAGLGWLGGVYLLTNKILGFSSKLEVNQSKKIAIRATALGALLPWAIHFSRVGFEGHLAAVLVTWALVGILSFLSAQACRARFWWWSLSLVASGLAFYTYFSVRYVWPVLLILVGLFFMNWSNKKLRFKHFGGLVLALILWVIITIPMWRADFYQASNQLRLSTANLVNNSQRAVEVNTYRMAAGNQWWSKLLYNQPTLLTKDLLPQVWSFLDPIYLFLQGDQNLRHNSLGSGLILFSLAPLFIAGWIYLWNQQIRLFWFLFLWWGIAILPAAVPFTVPHALRSLNAIAIFPIVLALGWWAIEQWLKNKKIVSKYRIGMFVLASVLVVIELFFRTYFLFRVYPLLSAPVWQDGYLTSARYLAQQRSNYDHIWVQVNDDRYYLYYLPYMEISWSQLQQQDTSAYKHWRVDNLIFADIGQEKLEDYPGKNLMVGELRELDLPKVQLKAVFGSPGRQIGVYEKD